MFDDDMTEYAVLKLHRLNGLLEELFGLHIDFEGSSNEHLRYVYEHYLEKRNNLIMENGLNGLNQNSDYAKAVLITEAARVYLREIAPKRIRKKRKG